MAAMWNHLVALMMREPTGATINDLAPRLHAFWVPCVAVALYVVVIFGGRAFMRSRPKVDTPHLLATHNYVLTAMSVVLSLGTTVEVLTYQRAHGWFALYCGASDAADAGIMRWGNWFYVSKYYELLDTVFLVIRKRDLSFLHVFHHIAVVFTCWLAVHDEILMGECTVSNARAHACSRSRAANCVRRHPTLRHVGCALARASAPSHAHRA